MVVAAIREEASGEIEEFNPNPHVQVHWLGVGQLGKLIRLFSKEGVDAALMAGRVSHTWIFSQKGSFFKGRLVIPDATMLRVLMSLSKNNTGSLIGGIIKEIETAGIDFIDSTLLMKSLLSTPGILTRRKPDREESKDMKYGGPIAREIARLDLGQTVVVKDQAVVAVEAMEGTDETIRRASRLAGGKRLTTIKASRPKREMRFDVPVIGLKTLEVFRECNVSALAIDSGRTLMLDRNELIRQADLLKITIVAV